VLRVWQILALQFLHQSGRGLDGVMSVPSTHNSEDTPKWGTHCLIACLMKGGKVLTPGLHVCSNASPRLRPHVAHFVGGQQPRSVSCHAEVAALNALPRTIKRRRLRQCTLVVVRPSYNSDTEETSLRCAKPCRECAAIICLGIKAVVYSDIGQLFCSTPEELMSEASHSSGMRNVIRSCSIHQSSG